MNHSEYKLLKLNTKQTFLAIVTAILVLIISQILSMLLGSLPVMAGLPAALGNVIAGILYPVFTLLGILILCKYLLKISLSACKITRFQVKPIWCLAAFIMPGLLTVIMLLIPGRWVHSPMDSAAAHAVITGGIFYYGLGAGIVEELIFRGVIMSAIEYRWNKKAAVIVPSLLFGIVHLANNELNFLSTIQLLIAGSVVGILFSLVAYETHSIWSGALMHSIWNMVIIGGIIHIATAADETSLFNYVLDTKSYMITGGDFGIEASIFSVALYLLFIVLALILLKRKADY